MMTATECYAPLAKLVFITLAALIVVESKSAQLAFLIADVACLRAPALARSQTGMG
jgi:hypothetical protein